ncbi:MAG: acyl-CoA dehydrogenase family protein [Myxococcales bacterium]|nr:acyl-CoA dehydrogenase family protein [Myxococcales bacterium]
MRTHVDLDRFAVPLSDDHRLVFQAARDFAAGRLAPAAQERDRLAQFPREPLSELGQMGYFGMKVSEADGGPGLDNVAYALVMEAIAEACASTAVVLASSNLVGKIMAEHASPEQKERWLTPYLRGALGPGSFALTEPGGGSDAAAVRTSARLEGDHWVLEGEKCWITGATEAGFHLVFARTDGEGKEGLSCILVERDTPGLLVGREEDKMGQRASGTATLAFDGCRVPAKNLIGERGRGYGIALSNVGAGRVGIAALSIGLAEAALASGRAYGRERRAFGRPLTDFQNTQFVLADCRTEIDAAWLMALRAARLLDRGERCLAETSMAKLFASEACGRVVDHMVQLHGGYGYSRDYEVERLYRDARVTRIYEGTSEIQRIIIARQMLGA